MKFALTIITLLCLCYIMPTHSRFDVDFYSTGNTVYRGVLGCGTTESGQVIYDPPENAQAYESWTIPVEGAQCRITVSTCFDSTGDDVSFNGFQQLDPDWTSIGAPLAGNCPEISFGPDNSILNDILLEDFVRNPECQRDGSISGLLLTRIGTVSVDGSANYTIALRCSDDCNVCTIDPELDELQQIEDAKDVSPAPAPVNCTQCVAECDECSIDSSSDSSSDTSSHSKSHSKSRSSSDDSSDDDARSELERMDKHDIVYKYEHGQEEGTKDDDDELKVENCVDQCVFNFSSHDIKLCIILCLYE